MNDLIKIKAENSNHYVMFFNKNSYKFNDLIDVLFFESSPLIIEPNILHQLIKNIKTSIFSLIESDDFLKKEKGNSINIDGKKYYLNVKSSIVDKRIQTLYSLLKIASYCKEENLNLIISYNNELE